MMSDSQVPSLRRVLATRFVLPLREGGSVPGLFEADDDGMYVVKLHGAAQGPKTLTAELIVGEIGRALGLNVPELVLVDLVGDLTAGEPDPEIQDHLQRSLGLNLGLDFLPGAMPFDPSIPGLMHSALAADIVWFDAFVANIDRSTRNPNMLIWNNAVWLIDHGAAIFPHHRWTDPVEQSRRSFSPIRDHILLPQAGSLVDADARLAPLLDETLLWSIVGSVPDEWLTDTSIGDAEAQRNIYMTYFTNRLQHPRPFIAEAEQLRQERSVGEIDPDRATRGRRRE